jgi:RNA polymerase sigma-70 factor (ECF subfamily)
MRAETWERCRPELAAYAAKLVARPEIGEEIAQEAAVRLLADERLPDDPAQIRAWLFRVATNLALDYLRRHSTWRETAIVDLRRTAEADPEFVAASDALRGSPEMEAIAREHLAVCFACTMRNLPPQQSAALLLASVHGFSTREAAAALDASEIQVKNWLQQARRTLTARYAHTCALVARAGVCHQCIELDGFFNGRARDPLEGTRRDLEARIEALRDARHALPGRWHRALLRLADEELTAR